MLQKKKGGLETIEILDWAKQECSEFRQYLQEQKTLECFERRAAVREGGGDN